ncbi:MAG: tetratricopeptide repeat protein, partial [Pirellulaceae bacterium]|nr:tetratricopeptide repeat protein [Pirellulaceae bacterium]
MYRLLCPCGLEMEIRGSQAGCRVTCACGKESQVPPLRELKVHHDRNEATPTIEVVEKEQATTLSQPQVQFIPCCGKVGGDGDVSHLALNHYVELVHWQISETIRSIELPTFAEFVLSIALAPGDRKRIEFDFYPKDANIDQLELLRNQLNELRMPLINEAPIAFGLYVSMQPVDNSQRLLSLFPSLTGSIKSLGMEAAICQAFDLPTGPKKDKRSKTLRPHQATWWQRLFTGWKSKSSIAVAEQSARQEFLEQERWLKQCEQMAADFSWIDLKRALVDMPDDLRFRVAFAEKHCQQGAWEVAIQWYDGLVRQLPHLIPLIGRRAALHRQVGNSHAALLGYSEAIEKAPHEASYRIERSFLYAELQAWAQALADIEEAIRLTPRDPGLFFQRAQLHLQQSKPSEAVDDFREAIRFDPNFGQAHFHLGWLYSCLNPDKGLAAIEHLTRAIALTHNHPGIRLSRGVAYLAQNKFALAMEDCHHVLAIEPNHAQAHGVLGRILQCEGQFEEAIEACTRAIELGDEQAQVYLARAISYANTNQPTLAVSDCDAVLALEPNNALAIQLHGRLMLQSGDLDAAMDAFYRARELAPDWAEPREQLSLVHLLKEDPRASVDEQSQLIERQPKDASHYVNRAFALTQLQEFVEAANDYDHAIELEPDNERLYFLRGVFRMNCQLHELALADFERVLAITGGDDAAREHRAGLLLRLNRYQEAIEDYAQLIAKYPENPLAYSGRAFAYAALGNNDRAQEDTNRAAEMSPELADGIHQRTQVASVYRLVHAQDYDSALEAANQMVTDCPDESLGYRLRAFVYWEREEFVEACEDYNRVIDLDGPTSDCRSSRGQVLAELGDWDRALIDLNQAVDMARRACQTIVLAYALNGRSLTLAGL